MPHATLKLHPGVDQNRTPALNEAAISETNLIRFVPDKEGLGLVQKLGGWTKYPNAADAKFPSIIRALWAWQDTNARSYLGVGCETDNLSLESLYVIPIGAAVATLPITPKTSTFNVPFASTYSYTISTATTFGTTATVTFNGYRYFSSTESIYISGNTVSGYNGFQPQIALDTLVSPTYNQVQFDITAGTAAGTGGTLNPPNGCITNAGDPTVTINVYGSNVNSYDSVDIKTQISVGGLILFGTYPCIFYDINGFQIVARDALGDPTPAVTSVPGPIGGGVLPTFNMTVDQATITVTLPDHGNAVGDIFPVLIPINSGTVVIYGNYTVNTVISSSQFTISTNTSATSIRPFSFSGDGTYATVSYANSYKVNVGDQIDITNSGSGYDTSAAVVVEVTVGINSSSAKYANATTGSIVVPSNCTLFNTLTLLNGGNANFVVYRTPAPLPTGVGYGIGGYGDGGYGTGVIPPFGTSGTQITATDWTLDNWGEIFIACPVGGAIYQWGPNIGSTIASVIPQAPIINDGVFVAMPQRQLVAWGSTYTGIQDPLLIRWSDVGDFNSWIPLLTNQAGSYRLPRGSRIVSAGQGPQQGIVWTDIGVWAMQYSGPPYVYQFNEIGTGCGLISRKAACAVNGIFYWMGQSQFFQMGGTAVQPIPCPVWDVIFQDLDTNYLDKIRAAPNSNFGEVAWYYPSKNNGGEVNRYVKYNILLNQWDFGILSRTAWINQSVLGPPIGAGITSDNSYYIYQHETSPDADGQVMESFFQTGYFIISEAEYKVFVDQVWPDMKWGLYDGIQNAHVNMTFYYTDYPAPFNDPKVRQSPPYNISLSTDYVTPRFRGRLMSIRMESSPNEIGTFWRLGAMRYRFEQDGKF